MDPSGAPAGPDPGGGVTPPAAFYGLWPRFAAAPEDGAVDEARLVALPAARPSAADHHAGA